VIFAGLDVAAARRTVCGAAYGEREKPTQVALALRDEAPPWVPRGGGFDASRGPRARRPEKKSAAAPLDSGRSKPTPDYPGVDRETAAKLMKSRKALAKNRAKLTATNRRLAIVTGVHAARRRKAAWHP